MARRTSEFSERDRVPFGALVTGERFVHRGKLWIRTSGAWARTSLLDWKKEFAAKTVVVVSRASRIAHRYLSARRAGQEAAA